MSKILITAKISPDLDGVACAFAYAKLMKKSIKAMNTLSEFLKNLILKLVI